MKLKNIVLVLLAAFPLLYLAMIWNTLPGVIAIHFNINGKANGFGDKWDLLSLIAPMSIVNIITFLLLTNMKHIDPKRAEGDRAMVFNKLATGLVIFLTAINMLIIISGLHPEDELAGRALLPLLGCLFMFLGNYMYTVKPNYFVGIRVPWTMSNEDNWRETHRLAGVVWFIGGLFIAISSFFVPIRTGHIMMQIAIAIMVLLPVGYSFYYFRKHLPTTHK